MTKLQFTFHRASPVVIEQEVVDDVEDVEDGGGMLDVLVSNVWSRGAGVDGLTLASTVDKDSTVDIDSQEKLKTCVLYFFKKGTIAGVLVSPVLVKPLGKGRGSFAATPTAQGTACSTATVAGEDDEKWKRMKDGVLMWTAGMEKKVARMAEADKQGKLVAALVNEEAPADERMYPGSMLTKGYADALRKAAAGVRQPCQNNNVLGTCRPRSALQHLWLPTYCASS